MDAELLPHCFEMHSRLNDESVNSHGRHSGDALSLIIQQVIAGSDNHLIAVLSGVVIDSFDDLVGKGIGDVTNDHADQIRLFVVQRTRNRIGMIIGSGNDIFQFPARLIGHFVEFAVEKERNSCLGDSGEFCNIIDCDSVTHPGPSCLLTGL